MKNNRVNSLAKWVIVVLALGGILFNTAILYNDVKHLKKQMQEVKQEIRDLRNYLMGK